MKVRVSINSRWGTGFTGSYRVLPGFTGIYRNFPGLSESYQDFLVNRRSPVYGGFICKISIYDKMCISTKCRNVEDNFQPNCIKKPESYILYCQNRQTIFCFITFIKLLSKVLVRQGKGFLIFPNV